jgi:hypothetical protein
MAKKTEYNAFADVQVEGDWRVEAVNEDAGEVYVTIFSGPNSELRAVEYAMLKNGTHPLFEKLKAAKTASAPEPAPFVPPVVQNVYADSFVISPRNVDYDVVLHPNDMAWRYDAKRKKVSGEPKPAVERLECTTKKKEGN